MIASEIHALGARFYEALSHPGLCLNPAQLSLIQARFSRVIAQSIAAIAHTPPAAANERRMNGVQLSRALGFQTPWVVSAVKKANANLASQGKEAPIFTGRYSTVAAVSAWLDHHPTFIARHVLVSNERQLVYAQRKLERRTRQRKQKKGGAS